MDDVISLAPAHLEQVLSGFGGNGAQTADKDDVLGFELREGIGKRQPTGHKRRLKENYLANKSFIYGRVGDSFGT